MTLGLEKKRNYLIYPVDALITKFVQWVFAVCQLVLPNRFSGRIDKLKESNSVRNFVGLTLFNALGGFLLMLTNVKLANVLGASLFGIYSYYLAVGEVGANFVRYGRHKTMIRDLIQFPTKFHSIIANSLVLGLLNSTLYFLVILIFSDSLDIEISLPALLLVISPILVSLDFQPVYEALKMMGWHSIYNLLQKLFFLVVIWSAIFFDCKVSLLIVGLSLIISWMIVLAVQYWEVITQLKVDVIRIVTIDAVKKLYTQNFWIALSCMIGVAFGPYIRLILKNYVDSTSVGIYSAGFQIYLMSQFILHQVSRVGNPKMAQIGKFESSKKDVRRFVNQYVLIMIIAALPFVLFLMLMPGLITDFCFTEEYSDLRYYLPYFGIYILAISIGNVYEQLLISFRSDKIYFAIYTGGALLTIVVGYIIIPLWGVLGGVLTLVVPGVLTRLLYLLFGEAQLKKTRNFESYE